jgi:hypothetical protein
MTDGGFDPPTGPPAGWYPDPYDPARQRYWDGRVWDLTMPTAGAGPSDEYPNVGDWLDRSFRHAYRRWRAVIPVAIISSFLPTVFGFLALDRLVEGLVIVDEDVEGWTNDRLPMVITYFALAAILSIVGTLALTRLMLDTVDGHSAGATGTELRDAGRSIASVLRALPRAIGWALLLVAGAALVIAAGVVIAVAVPALGVVLLVVAIPFAVWLAIKWAFLLVAIIDRRGEPFTRSSRVSRGRWWPTLGRLLLLGIIVWLISLLVQIAAAVLTGGDYSAFGTGSEFQTDSSLDTVVLDDELDFSAWVLLVSAVMSTLATVVTTSVVSTATALLYRTRNPLE